MKTVIFLSLVATAAALSCGTCELEKCPTLSCQGGVFDDACGCCKECAKLDGQSCGGPFEKYGQCDEGLECELIVAVGGSLTPDAHGVCRGVPKTDSEVTNSFTSQDSQDSSYIQECEIKSYSGCNLVSGKCACSEDVQTCINPFQFADLDECRQVVRVQNGSIEPEPTPADCSQARCEIVFDIHCPTDSLKIEAQREEGECCPRPPQCLCDMGACHDVICAEGFKYHEISAGNGRPGSCCDTYECRPISEFEEVLRA